MEGGQTRLVADFHGRAVLDRLGDGVGVDQIAEDPHGGTLEALVDWGAGEADEGGVGQGLTHSRCGHAVLGAVGFVDHHVDVGGVVEGRAALGGFHRLLELLDRGHDRPAGVGRQELAKVRSGLGLFRVGA